jgi:hypothetical protein
MIVGSAENEFLFDPQSRSQVVRIPGNQQRKSCADGCGLNASFEDAKFNELLPHMSRLS